MVSVEVYAGKDFENREVHCNRSRELYPLCTPCHHEPFGMAGGRDILRMCGCHGEWLGKNLAWNVEMEKKACGDDCNRECGYADVGVFPDVYD